MYVTLGGHGCWNISGNNAWYQDLFIEEYRECIDETSDDGDVLYPVVKYRLLRINIPINWKI